MSSDERPQPHNFIVEQGKTWSRVLQWESERRIYKPITAGAPPSFAPLRLTVTGHGMPAGWHFQISGLHAEVDNDLEDVADVWQATVVDANTVEINNVVATGLFELVPAGAVLIYNEPVDLAQYTTWRAHIREKLTDATFITGGELTNGNGGIVIDTTAKTITLQRTAAETAAFDFTTARYDVEAVTAAGLVHSPAYGTLTLIKESTR